MQLKSPPTHAHNLILRLPMKPLLPSLIFLLILVAGCNEAPGNSNSADSMELYDGPVEWLIQQVPGQPIFVPRDIANEVSLEDREALFAREEIAISSCMAEQGFHYEPLPVEDYFISDNSRAADYPGRPPIDDVEAALSEAFGPPPSNSRSDEDSNSNGGIAYSLALLGEPPEDGQQGVIRVNEPRGYTLYQTNSCIGRAKGVVYGDAEKALRINEEINSVLYEMEELVHNDPEYIESINKWRKCMAKNGIYSQHPEEIPRALIADYLDGKITEQQYFAQGQESAVAHADCVVQSSFVAANNRAVETAARRVARQAERLLISYQEITENALSKSSTSMP